MAKNTESESPVYVTISALDAGHLTFPDHLLVADSDPEVCTTIPSLSFLIQHPSSPVSRDGNVTNIVFDLGVKRDLSGYSVVQQANVAQRQPIITDPDCSASLRMGVNNEGKDKPLLNPETEVDFVILSHVHWDHTGTPSDFARATFIVGSGTLDLLKHGAAPFNPAEEFNADELPASRTVELPPCLDWDSEFDDYYAGADGPMHTLTPADTQAVLPACAADWAWQPFASLPRTIDFFGDGSVHVVDSPGHMYGHVNLLVRTAADKYVYLASDACHDTAILDGTRYIAEYEYECDDDGSGSGSGSVGLRSVHVDTHRAARTLAEIADAVDTRLLGAGVDADVEVVLAHDKAWRERNLHRFWPGKL